MKKKDLLPHEVPDWLSNSDNPPKDSEDRKFIKLVPKWKRNMKPLDWLYELFWSESKIYPSTHLINPDDYVNDIGPGRIDFFEYLRTVVRAMHLHIPFHNYERKYYVFHKLDPWKKTAEDLPKVKSVKKLLKKIKILDNMLCKMRNHSE